MAIVVLKFRGLKAVPWGCKLMSNEAVRLSGSQKANYSAPFNTVGTKT
jgi:hypothetical protein